MSCARTGQPRSPRAARSVAAVAVTLALVFTAAVVGGCSPPKPPPPAEVSVAEEFDIVTLDSVDDPKVLAWIQQNSRVKGVHVARFDETTYVLASRGLEQTGGGDIIFVDAFLRDDGIHLVFEVCDPDQGDVTQEPDHPAVVLATERDPAEMAGVETRGPEVLDFARHSASNSAIVVTEPLVGTQVSSSPLLVRGHARVFEGTVQLRLEDGHNVLARTFTTATAGGPAWGEFEIELEFETPTSPGLTLTVFEESARDGSEINVVVIPLQWVAEGP